MYNEIFDLTGKKAIVTGGAGDLGASMVDGLVRSGADTVIIDLSDRGEELAKKYRDQGFGVWAVKTNLGDREELERNFAKAVELLGGRVDSLVNSAGIQIRHPSELFPLEDWDKVSEINLTATFRCCQLAAQRMLEQGKGKIINVASVLSFFGGYTVPAYAASKGGVAQLTKAFANESAAKGININATAPRYYMTHLNDGIRNNQARREEFLSRIPQKRFGDVEDISGIVVFLASAASDYVNGAVIPVDGGFTGR